MKTNALLRAALLAVSPLPAADSAAVKPTVLDKVEVTARQEAFYNAIDRKVYLVGKDVVSGTGSASDLLQNVPSVQVDVEGNVSLRGDGGVSLLVNGKSSAALARDPAAALEAMPADAIERVEIITNPSAKYRPDGTAGIINLVLKRKASDGRTGSARANVGNDDRYNASLSGSDERGRLALHGHLALRQDSRPRHGIEERVYPGSGDEQRTVVQRTEEHGRPRSVFADIGFEYQLGPHTEAGAGVGFGSRRDTTYERQLNLTRTGRGAVTRDDERIRSGREKEREWEFELKLAHEFGGRDRALEFELQREVEDEREDDAFETLHRMPARGPGFERTSELAQQTDTEITIDYTHEFGAGAKLEAGYAGEIEESDRDSAATFLDAATDQWIEDAGRSDRFIHDSAVHAIYATYGRTFGRFGALGGLRFEQAQDDTERPGAAVRGESDYRRLYPSLHFSYDLGDAHRVQLNYSHRVDRPDGDDLNPYVDYEDPSHLRAGNPALRPENVHSVEAGYEFRAEDTTFLASVYHRYRYDGITDVTRILEGGTLLTTPENVGTSRSSGLELGATSRWRKQFALNFSANVYRHELDARNLGFTGRRAAIAWEAKLNAHWDVSDRLMLQVNTSYRARRLTPQGERLPSAVTNLGVRYDLKDGKTSFVATVSDVFASLRDRTVIDTAALQSTVTRQRSSRVFYLGIVRHFGKAAKRSGEEMEFDDSL